MTPGKEGHGGSDGLIAKNFVEILRGNTETYSTPQAARYSIATGCLATESLRNGGKPRSIPKLPTELEQHNFAEN